MTQVENKHQWPTREEWAERHRSAYWDSESPHPYTASRKLSLYATPEEIGTSIAALRKIWCDYGHQMKTAKARIGPLAQQPGERNRDYTSRYLAMSDEEQELVGETSNPQWWRREVNKVIEQLRDGSVPWRLTCIGISTLPAPLDAIIARYEAAVQAGNEKYVAEVAARPIDDAAWAEELRHRRRIDEYLDGFGTTNVNTGRVR
jgi:hypothetical protein